MEHITIKDLGNGYVRLTANEGYRLYSVNLDRVVSEAIIHPEDVELFKAIPNA